MCVLVQSLLPVSAVAPVVIGIMSDTHGNTGLMFRAADAMTDTWNASVIIHLGDDYADAQSLAYAGHDVRSVPGLWCDAYRDPSIPKQRVEAFDGVSVGFAHADKDLRYTERAASIVLVGHTHHAALEHIGRTLHMNPGHLAKSTSRGHTASYAVLDIQEDRVDARIVELSGRVRSELSVSRDRLADG